MFEKVNPAHPDKVADRIAGAIVDLAYANSEGGIESANPRIAVEVLIGHGKCYIIIETSLSQAELSSRDVDAVVKRLCPDIKPSSVYITISPQDPHLSKNQEYGLRCGDNGIFKGVPVTDEQSKLAAVADAIYEKYPYDGKYIIYNPTVGFDSRVIYNGRYALTICQSHAKRNELSKLLDDLELKIFYNDKLMLSSLWRFVVNPLGEWTGGVNVDSGATNRKLGSDMGDAVTGGGLMGKDLSKMDVTANILCHLKAQESGQPVECTCAIGDDGLEFRYADERMEIIPVCDAVEMARRYIISIGGFEKFAEWGLIRNQ